MADSIWPIAGIFGVTFIVAAVAVIVAINFRNGGPKEVKSQEKKKPAKENDNTTIESLFKPAETPKLVTREKYKKDPEFSLLHPLQKQALNLGAIDGEAAGFYCNSLTTGKNPEELKQQLAETFHLGPDKTPAKTVMHQLFNQGCRTYFERFKQDFLLTDRGIWEQKTKAWFSEPTEAELCLSYMYKLEQAMGILIQEGYFSSKEELLQQSILAFDLSRLAYISRSCVACEYLTQDEAWSVITAAYKTGQNHYQDWNGFARGYLVGRAMWDGQSAELSDVINIVRGLLQDQDSPWIANSFK